MHGTSPNAPVTTIAELQGQLRQKSRQVVKRITVSMPDPVQPLVVKFEGRWTNYEMKAVDRALRRGFRQERSRMRKADVRNNGGY